MKSLGKNYIPGSMSFAEGFFGPKRDEGFFKNFDFEKIKKIDLTRIEKITAGLDGDWGCNSQVIFVDGKWANELTFHTWSCWATPIVLVEYNDSPMEAFECWQKKTEDEIKNEAKNG